MIERLHFCATGKKGLGHLRRITNIAVALKQCTPETSLSLVTNAPPAGMTGNETELYADIAVIERDDMSRHLAEEQAKAVVVDTAVLPGISELDARLGLLLRETRESHVERFALENGRQWDLLMIPNPGDHWKPDPEHIPAHATAALGWIYRRPDEEGKPREEALSAEPRLLIASGGGGSGATWQEFRTEVGEMISALKNQPGLSCSVSQILGPRAGDDARIGGVDEYLQPGPNLHELFAQFDLVISTAGYNSTLELACTDVPVLFVPREMTYDDQAGRARYWASRLGYCHEAGCADSSADWIAGILRERARRAPIDLQESGATTAAGVIKEWLQ